MSELLPFCKIKLQYLLEMVTDHELDDNALRVALYLALAHDTRFQVSLKQLKLVSPLTVVGSNWQSKVKK